MYMHLRSEPVYNCSHFTPTFVNLLVSPPAVGLASKLKLFDLWPYDLDLWHFDL